MTTTTTGKGVSPQDALAAAEAAYKSAQDAYGVAHATSSRQALDDAEAAAAQAIADAVTGTGDRATADAARERVEKLRRDHEWAAVELQAAERAMGRAHDAIVRARRGVIAEEYLAAHKTHNDPKARVNVLQAELPGLVAEFVELAEARDALHARLAQEFQHLTADERAAVNIPTGQPVVGVGQTGPRPVFVRTPALVDILKAAGLEVGGR
jgi:murein L,D-transpeptidase YcbB/YkuD